ncbi:SusC/RagA family TonB-linked outer membrane protein [Odoribacter splanchnicus]|uniref:SusC/RagA family TonB-linked outer membrane protein n=1 Tax=Odoribacter splanchnicus TaxID=28118 RepID=UPI000E4E5F42|nr:SusC/RagA family TonB-linked outer membrane protein [Odoribacter splanchnicus]MBS1446715.1 SusC/RagA family TonB-linked outer membrane protein [Odoribacter sp.]MDB9231537.1 SusC/RagA family TonB-linked outer membrane protein [Odoribacter splanchnicus]RHA42502.1 SusC/RagA family TonB-linked outer membrane protein [Odoribacter splanchnicus]
MKKKRLDDFPHRGRWSQILLRMKLTFVLVFCMLVQTFAAVNAQTVTLKKQNASLEEIIWELKEQTKFVFLYSSADIATVKGIDIDMQNSQIDAILKKCLEGTDLQFVKENNAIIIRQANGKTAVPQVQSRKITGKVIDEDGNPLPGVAVLIEGTTIGVATDMDGKYDLTCPEMKDIVLKFSYIGMKPKSVVVGNKTVVDVTLESDSQEMDEVVVTGLLNRRKSGFAGTTTVISKQELAKVSTGNIFTTISTLDAGFKIEENNLDGSNPNKLPDFTIRGKGSFQNGSTAPIFILDGFEVTSQKVFDMDINRIESITLLKDASATILYGSRASNGVIVIETTAPKAGKLRVTYDFKPTIAIVDLTDYDLMNAREKLQYEKEAGLYTQEITPGYEDNDRREQGELDKAYYNRYKNIVEGVNTYWLSQPVKNAFSHAHSLFVEGGADNVRYGIDASYNQNKGVMKESGRDRFGLGFSLIYRIKDKITIKNYISYAHTHAYNSPYGSFSQYAKLNPYERIYNDNGELIPKLSDGDTNPLYDALLPNRNFTKDQEFREQLSVDWFICDGLRLKGQMAIVKGETSGEIYKSPFSAEFLKTTYNSESRVQEYLPIAERGYLSMTDGASFSYDGNVTLNYNTLVNEKHIIYAGAGLEVTQNDNNSHGFIMTGFPDDRYSDPAFAIQYKKETKPSSSESKSRAIGFFANGNYSYDDRYFADVSVRIDGSSKFGADKKYAPFWSAGAGWNVHNEKFFKHTKISMLKLRYSYGVTGNQEFSAYQAKTMFQFNTDRLYNSGISAALMGYGNPDLEWQNQYQSNYGFDFGYAKDRIRLQFNYYQKKTEGMLTSVSVAPSLGLPSNTFTSNLGKIQNKGVEVNLNAVLIRDQGKDFEWSVMLQAAHNKNKIMEISTALKNINEKNNQDKTTPAAVYEEGESMSAIKAVPSLGIDPTTGQELFMKKDGTITYTWDATDKVICGDSEPKVFGNVGTNLYWKGWNLNMVFKYDLGADYYNSTLAERVEGANPRYNADRRVLNNRWKEPGQHALYKNIKEYTTTYISSRFVQKENTLQLTSLSLSYDLNREWIRKFGLNTMRLSFYMNDVFRASTVKNERGLDYPFQRSFVFGLNIGF